MSLFGLFGRPNVAELKAEGDIPELVEALQFPDDHNVRFEAASALGDIGDSRCVEPLIESLNDRPRIKEVAIRSLGQIGDPQAIPPLVNALEDQSWEIRSMAAKSLGNIGDARAAEALINTLEGENETVRWYVIQALESITGENFNDDHEQWREWYQKNKQKGTANE
jgi:HEAT repeat protein